MARDRLNHERTLSEFNAKFVSAVTGYAVSVGGNFTGTSSPTWNFSTLARVIEDGTATGVISRAQALGYLAAFADIGSKASNDDEVKNNLAAQAKVFESGLAASIESGSAVVEAASPQPV